MDAATRIFLAGTGSFASEVSDWARAAGLVVEGVIELQRRERVGQRFHGLEAIDLDDAPAGGRAMIAVGGDRRAVADALAAGGWRVTGLCHPRASLARDVALDPAATVGPMAVIGSKARIGPDTILNRGAMVGHHAEIQRGATLNPGVNIGGHAHIGAGSFLGMGCTVANGIRVGEEAVVAAGAVVVEDVADGVRVQGVPARLHPR
jgi:UDP-perosamine 4-acetyltransferase